MHSVHSSSEESVDSSILLTATVTVPTLVYDTDDDDNDDRKINL